MSETKLTTEHEALIRNRLQVFGYGTPGANEDVGVLLAEIDRLRTPAGTKELAGVTCAACLRRKVERLEEELAIAKRGGPVVYLLGVDGARGGAWVLCDGSTGAGAPTTLKVDETSCLACLRVRAAGAEASSRG